MTQEEFKRRTKSVAVQSIRLAGQLPKTPAGFTLAKQLIRSGTSVGSNYRAACRARSKAEMIAKLCIVQEEADETIFWLECLKDSEILDNEATKELYRATEEVLKMTVASLRTLKSE